MCEGIIIYILFAHWVSDFLFQSRWMGENKSTYVTALLSHIGVYTLSMFTLMVVYCIGNLPTDVPAFTDVLIWSAVNGCAHLFTDAITSNVTKWAYTNKQMHLFWSTIGADQFIHAWTLIATARILL